jgi:hypothetical protein
MREALNDPQLLGAALPGESWLPWRVLLIAAMGEPLLDEERPLFETLTGRTAEPLERVDELWGICGRRAGKTRAAGTASAYVGALCDHRQYLASGERGSLPILAANTTQATRAFQHTRGVLQDSPVLSRQIDGEPTSDTIRLKTGVDIEIRPASFRTIRGITAVAAIADEVAFWMLDGATNSDEEILAALRPSLATTGGPLIVISSPHAKRGELYKTFRRHYGAEGDPLILVAKGPSRTFNSTLSQRVVDKAYADDAAKASAEYGGDFRNDIEAYLSREIIESVTVTDRRELPTREGIQHVAFTDPSGGAADSFCIALAHREGEAGVLDVVRERRPPFSPDAVVEEFATLLKSYGVNTVRGDRYSGEFNRELFRKHGIDYQYSELTASDVFREFLPLINAGRVELLDNARLADQLAALERRTSRTGKELISHPPQGHDDLAVCIAGALHMAVGSSDAFTIEQYVKAWGYTAPSGPRPLTAPVNRLTADDYAVKLAPLRLSHAQLIYNDGANTVGVFPADASTVIDGGLPGASMTLPPGQRRRFTCIAPNLIESAPLGSFQ